MPAAHVPLPLRCCTSHSRRVARHSSAGSNMVSICHTRTIRRGVLQRTNAKSVRGHAAAWASSRACASIARLQEQPCLTVVATCGPPSRERPVWVLFIHTPVQYCTGTRFKDTRGTRYTTHPQKSQLALECSHCNGTTRPVPVLYRYSMRQLVCAADKAGERAHSAHNDG